jgi:hypothetical protein
MKMRLDFRGHIQIINQHHAEELALELFAYQYAGNEVYRRFSNGVGCVPDRVRQISDIPFLPVSFFKTHKVTTAVPEEKKGATFFESSTTTGSTPSVHYVPDVDLYKASLLQGFHEVYGNPKNYVILALLPSYLERSHASLVFMAQHLIEEGGHTESGFFLDDFASLHALLVKLEGEQRRVLLLGVTFALIDFATLYPTPLSHTIVMETGGMKGRRKELTREEVHELLKQGFGLKEIHSEYGMTEMLSQAYAVKDGVFRPSSTMKVMVGDPSDPLDVQTSGRGLLKIIDFANRDSCAFLATEDLGEVMEDGSFTVTGRADHSALRGCSLMAV